MSNKQSDQEEKRLSDLLISFGLTPPSRAIMRAIIDGDIPDDVRKSCPRLAELSDIIVKARAEYEQ